MGAEANRRDRGREEQPSKAKNVTARSSAGVPVCGETDMDGLARSSRTLHMSLLAIVVVDTSFEAA